MERTFLGMKVLHLDGSECLTDIGDISSLRNLEEFSFQRCENLLTIHDSIGFLNKLKILNAKGCSKLRSFPPIHLPSLQKLKLSCCYRLNNFPKILGKMDNIEYIDLIGTSIEELPDSFQNLTRLNELLLVVEGHRMLITLPSCILMMLKLYHICLYGYHLLPNQSAKPSSMVSSKVKSLGLRKCNLTDESLPIILMLFADVTHLDLSMSNFTILPKCIKEHRSLRTLRLDDCKCIQEIRGIPPNLRYLSALNCESLSSSCRSMLLNRELQEVGSTVFCLPGTAWIPEWFEHQSKGWSTSFWFRNNIPSIALFVTSKLKHDLDSRLHYSSVVSLIINGYKLDHRCPFDGLLRWISPDHKYLFDLHLQDMESSWKLGISTPEEYQEQKPKLDKALLKNEWNRARLRVKIRRQFLSL